MLKKYFRRTWLEINTDALRWNYTRISEKLSPGVKMTAVVKADAYGHGVEHVVETLVDCGCEWFAVSNLEEALQVKSVAPEGGVLILGYTPPEYALTLAANGISQAVFNSEYAEKLADEAKKAGVCVNIHIKADTGMSRLGFVYHDSEEDAGAVGEIAAVCRLEGLYPEGIFTHFAVADEADGEVFTRLQYDLFKGLTVLLEKQDITFEVRHCCNSAATVLYPEMQLDMVRPGVILYGLSPSGIVDEAISLKPVMKMKTVISMVKEIPANTPVSYGGVFVSDKKMKIATVPVGYADGLPRALSPYATMTINGKKARVVGRICMDQCMLDVTDFDEVHEGDSVTVFGGNSMSVDYIAEKCGVINYEIICGINKRVPRVFKDETGVLAVSDYMVEKK